MRQYEVTFIVDPVLGGQEIKEVAQKYVDHLKNAGCNIVHVNEMGLRQLAYPINKRSTGIYYCVEFQSENGTFIYPLELEMRRDSNVLRFLTVTLDKYGVKYNQDRRDGKIAKAKRPVRKEPEPISQRRKKKKKKRNPNPNQQNQQKQQPKKEEQAPAPAEAPKAEAAPKAEPTPPPADKKEGE